MTLPAPNKPSRLAINECERYDSDRTVPEHPGGRTLQRRVVGQRLVHAEFFALN